MEKKITGRFILLVVGINIVGGLCCSVKGMEEADKDNARQKIVTHITTNLMEVVRKSFVRKEGLNHHREIAPTIAHGLRPQVNVGIGLPGGGGLDIGKTRERRIKEEARDGRLPVEASIETCSAEDCAHVAIFSMQKRTLYGQPKDALEAKITVSENLWEDDKIRESLEVMDSGKGKASDLVELVKRLQKGHRAIFFLFGFPGEELKEYFCERLKKNDRKCRLTVHHRE